MPPKGKPVNVTVTDSKLSITPYRIKIKSSGEEVVWKCATGTVRLLFNKDGMPFDSGTFPGSAGTEIHSGECAVTTNRLYHYTIVVNRSTSALPITIDPEVIVDDAGPPPKTGGKGGGGGGGKGKGKGPK